MNVAISSEQLRIAMIKLEYAESRGFSQSMVVFEMRSHTMGMYIGYFDDLIVRTDNQHWNGDLSTALNHELVGNKLRRSP